MLGKRLLSAIIAVAVTATSIEVPVYASEESTVVQETKNNENSQKTDKEGKAVPEVVKELKKERTVDSTTYLLNNGMKKTVYYSDNIRYEDENGKIREYNPALVKADESDKKDISKSKEITKSESEDYLYTNNQGYTKQYIPEKIDEDTPLLMTNEKYKVSFAPVSEDENVKDSAFSGETDKVSIGKDTIITSTEEEKQAKINAVYTDEKSNFRVIKK